MKRRIVIVLFSVLIIGCLVTACYFLSKLNNKHASNAFKSEDEYDTETLVTKIFKVKFVGIGDVDALAFPEFVKIDKYDSLSDEELNQLKDHDLVCIVINKPENGINMDEYEELFSFCVDNDNVFLYDIGDAGRERFTKQTILKIYQEKDDETIYMCVNHDRYGVEIGHAIGDPDDLQDISDDVLSNLSRYLEHRIEGI